MSREIRLEVEVPGTPEEVWETIATGPGVAAWFTPASIEPTPGGAITHDFGSFGSETGRITAWEPPHRYAYESPAEGGERPLGYEWLVETASGGMCIVRLVNSGFGDGEDWDEQYDGMQSGWHAFMVNLRLYRTHFAGLPSSSVLTHGQIDAPLAEAWPALAAAVGISPACAEGDRVSIGGGTVPTAAGTVASVADTMRTLVIDEPAPGLLFVAAEPWADSVMASVYLYFYGDGAAEVADKEGRAWSAWMEGNFPRADAPANT